MLKFQKITFFIGCLLVNTLVASCGCGEMQQEAERKQLVTEEKKLTKEQEDFFKKNFTSKLTPEQQKQFEQNVIKLLETQQQYLKNDASVKKLNHLINQLETSKRNLESGDKLKVQAELDEANNMFTNLRNSHPNFPIIKIELEAAKQLISLQLAILNNLKKQAELRNKGKKHKGSIPKMERTKTEESKREEKSKGGENINEERDQLVAEENELTKKLERKFVLKHQVEFKQGFAKAKNERTVGVWNEEIKKLEFINKDNTTINSEFELAKILQQLMPSFALGPYMLSSKYDEIIKEIAAEYLLLAINQKKQAELKQRGPQR